MEQVPYSSIEDGLKRLEGKEYISDSTVDFFRDIIKAQQSIKNRLKDSVITPHLTEDAVKIKMQKGEPLISWDALPLQESCLKDLFHELCQIMKRQDGCDGNHIQGLIDAEGNGTIALDTLIQKLVQHDSAYFHALSGEVKVREDMLLFLALHLVKPFIELVAAAVRSKVPEQLWLRNYCPVCGGAPQMARLEKEAGKKILYCQLCGSEWRFLRIKCPFCCNEKQKNMRFLQVENSPYRIDFCDQCKRYIKTFDDRKGGDGKGVFIPSVEDLATMYLDLLAEREGYARSCFFPPSFDEVKAKEKKETIH